MIEGMNLEKTIDFVVPGDTENPTTWKIAPVPSVISGDYAIAGGPRDWKNTLAAVRVGLKGWDNYKIDGKDVDVKLVEDKIYGIKMDVLSMDIINAIPPLVLLDLMKEILRVSKISVTETKN